MDNFTLLIGNKNYSSWSLRPWILMKYFKIPFKEKVFALFQPGTKEAILKYSPAGKVPVLLHGKVVVWESIAIAEYLADLFPKKNLWPKDLEKRAHARSISAEMHAGFLALRKACPMNVRALNKPMKETTPDVDKDLARITAIWEDCRTKYKKDGAFLFGEFSVADCMYAPVVYRIRSYNLPVSGLAKEYYEMMYDLPEMKEWEEAGVKETFPAIH